MQRYRSKTPEQPKRNLVRYRPKAASAAVGLELAPVPAPKRDKAPAKRLYFTEKAIAKLKPKANQYRVWDAWVGNRTRGDDTVRGLSVLVSPLGTKSYSCVFYFSGKPSFITLGRTNEITLEEARDKAKECLAKAKKGIDPRLDDPAKSGSFKSLIEYWTEDAQKGTRGNKSADDTKKFILYNTKDWHDRPVGTLRFEEIDKRFSDIRDGTADTRPKPSVASRLHSHLKDFFSWCVRKRRIAMSPMYDMERPVKKLKSRDRVWFKKEAGDDAIKAIWKTADQLEGWKGQYLKTMLILGKRKTALVQMDWQHIDKDWVWDPPASDSSNKLLHGVPLPGLVQRIIHPRHPTGRVFGTPLGRDLDQLMDQVCELSGISDFFFHGLRHLAETKMAELRDAQGRSLVQPHIRDMLFDHAPKRGSGAGYDHHDYEAEKRQALDAWADYIEGLVAPEGVAVLR